MEKRFELFEERLAAESEPADGIPVESVASVGHLEEEDDVVIMLEKEEITSSTPAVRDQMVRQKTNKHMKKRAYTVGIHHGRINPLPSTWVYPQMNILSLITLWLIGNKAEGVPPLRRLTTANVRHFDNQGRTLSKMRKVMGTVESFAREKKVWVKFNEWNGETVTTLWSSIWGDLLPYLSTVTVNNQDPGSQASLHKTRASQISWRTCYNKMSHQGKLKKTHHSAKRESAEECKALEEKKRKANFAQQEKARTERAKAEKERQARKLSEKLRHEEEVRKKKEAMQRCKEIMRNLTQNEEDIARNTIYGIGQPEDILVTSGTDSVQRQSMNRLRPGTWLNDEGINFFLKNCLAKRDAILCESDPSRKRSHFFNSFFIQKMMREKETRKFNRNRYKYRGNIDGWGAKVPGGDVFNLKYIFAPWNRGNVHWCVAIIKMEEKRIEWHDSFGGNNRPILNALFQWLKDEHWSKKGCTLPDADKWTLISCSEQTTPQQENGENSTISCSVIIQWPL